MFPLFDVVYYWSGLLLFVQLPYQILDVALFYTEIGCRAQSTSIIDWQERCESSQQPETHPGTKHLAIP
jgi:hypothetical protein